MESENSADGSSLRCDVLLFVATSSEKEKLKEAAGELELSFVKKSGGSFRYYDLGQVGTYKVMAVRCEMGPFSFDGSAARALAAQRETRATALISVGMAFGVDRGRQKLGDVLISKTLLPYDNRTITCSDGNVTTDFGKVRAYEAKPSLLNMLEAYRASGEFQPGVEFGALLTGGARIHCARFRDQLKDELKERGGEVVGGEMEGAGLIATCPEDSPNWVLVKGISDFADSQRDEEVEIGRPLACKNSALFVLTALKNFNP